MTWGSDIAKSRPLYDPAGLAAVDLTNPQTWNRYAYVANNPQSNVDPFGLYCGPGSVADGNSETGCAPAQPPDFGDSPGLGNENGFGPQRPGPVMVTQHPGEQDPPFTFQVSVWDQYEAGIDEESGGGGASDGGAPSTCLAANIAAVNQVSKLNVNMSNVVGQPYIFNGGLNVNFSVPGASPSQLPPGRYPSSFLNRIFGIGHSLHVTPPGGADPSTYGVDSNGNFTFTTHIDTAYSTWHTPIGAIIHIFVDVRDKGTDRDPC